MRIKVIAHGYDYMGLCCNTIISGVSLVKGKAYFELNGKQWELYNDEFVLITELPEQIDILKPIKSDGGSSGYYDFKVPQHYLELIDNTGIIKTEYLIDILFGNDFDFACAFKALVRAKGITEGAGKEGNTLDYELNKVRYYSDRVKEKYGWKDE